MGLQYKLSTRPKRSKRTLVFPNKLLQQLSAFVAFATVFHAIQTANAQLVNTPPVLYMPERNWIISETEKVGQVIARVRADDAEGDELVFGIEPRFLTLTNDGSAISTGNLPFRIDPVAGVVYLNQSIVGRAGENILLYVTVSDGQFSAKNEVFVNILSANDQKHQNNRTPPSISNIVQNILPSFESLPGVQSVRNKPYVNRHPTNNFPPGFGLHQQSYGIPSYNPISNLNVHTQPPVWTADSSGTVAAADSAENVSIAENTTSAEEQSTTSRTKLTPIVNNHSTLKPNSISSTTAIPIIALNNITYTVPQTNANKENILEIANTSATFTIKSPIILFVIAACGLSVAAAIIIAVVYRKNLCAISKALKKKTKEEMTKKSNQSNLSSTLTDDSRNSMVMQHWNGPIAYGNRYVPWERDTQLVPYNVATLPCSPNGVAIPGDFGANAVLRGSLGQAPIDGEDVGADGIPNNFQNKYDRWEFPRHRLKFFNILGEGAFGQVWRCEATDIEGNEGITTVAVKTLKENATEVEKKDLISELEVMKSLEPHVNVVRFLGCCTDKDPVFVILEYVNRGKLQTFLRNSRAERHYGNTHGKSSVLTSGDLTSFMYQVAKGMDFLTSRGIIHRDLAARNILIADDHTCKVADFGFARDVVTSKIYERKSEGKLPIRWMAIESLYDNIFSAKSDIWSFGILMWEIVTLGSTPYPGISAADVMRKVRDGYRLEKPEHCRRELYNIMYYCWAKDQNERPTFGEIVEMLDKLLHTEMDYIELERFPDHNYYNILNLSGEKV